MRRSNFTHSTPRLAELRFLYQPIVALRSDEHGWSEALIRWQLADGTIRGPLDILPHWLAASRHETFTRFTLERAASAIAATPTAHISVNLSPAQVMHPGTITALERLLPSVRDRLRIELTEQQVFNSSALWDSLALIREHCSMVLLDDVTPTDLDLRMREGAPVDGVKLDRSVVSQLQEADTREATLRFIRDATERFPLVVAEGVEDPDLCAELFALDVSHAQGFGIARPDVELDVNLEQITLSALLQRTLRPKHMAARPCLND